MGVMRLVERRRTTVALASMGAVMGVLLLHYTTSVSVLGIHDVLRRLFYLPVIIAAIAWGVRGGLVTAGVAGVGYIPHLVQLARVGGGPLDNALEFVLLPVVGGLVGAFADSSRRLRALAAERGRLAAVGEVSLAFMAQAEGPLASIDGQTESLQFLAGPSRDGGVGFAATIIREETIRLRRFLGDLRQLRHRSARELSVIDLTALVAGVVGDIQAGKTFASRVAMGMVAARVMIRADRGVVAYSLRSLIFGLLEATPAPRRLEVGVGPDGTGARVEIRVYFDSARVPNLEDTVTAAFGPDAREYGLKRALCVHLLRSEGALVEFRRVARSSSAVRVRFPGENQPRGLRAMVLRVSRRAA
jgi:hypothetical protein